MNYNKLIDNTLLKPEATAQEIKALCKEAKEYDFMSCCINPHYVSLVKEELKGSDVKVCTVIGFPLGQNTTETKVFETKKAIEDGADEIDMVINVGALKDHKDDFVENEIREIKKACGDHILKVIIETCLLTEEEKIRACLLSKNAKADFVKTSTGFSKGGATVEDIALMRKTVGNEMGVKASGGVRTHEDMLKMVEAGATRIGTSSGAKLM